MIYEIFCGSKNTMEQIKLKGARALNPTTMKFQVIDKKALYKIKIDNIIVVDEGKEHICAALFSNINLRKIAEDKGLIL